MRNFAKLLGIAVIAAVIGFSMTACGEEEEEKEKEKEKDVVVRFDSALYGTWVGGNTRLQFVTRTEGDYIYFGNAAQADTLIAKNGNTYTVKSSYGGREESDFTAVVGSDDKLTISEFSDDDFNRTYTKQAEF